MNSRLKYAVVALVQLSATTLFAGLIGDEVQGRFRHITQPSVFSTDTAIVMDPGEEFRGVAWSFGASGDVSVFVDLSDNQLRLGFDAANAVVFSSIYTSFNLLLKNLDVGAGLGISDVNYVGFEGVNQFTGGGPASWPVSITENSISIDSISGWFLHPGQKAIAVYDISFGAVPEPATLALAGIGGVAMIRRRR
ncbi:MAG: PEP-CTERM sorting domain-containing protein [Phycisphaerales bacterium]|nr:PEP-CTERM sorting domain-containing protein [Phycisphaerales bacterium]